MAEPLQLPPGFNELSIEQKIDYVQALWDRIAIDVDTIPLTEWQKETLDRRVEALKSHEGSLPTWEEVRDRLRKRLGQD